MKDIVRLIKRNIWINNIHRKKLYYLKALQIFIDAFGEAHANTMRVKEKLENLNNL